MKRRARLPHSAFFKRYRASGMILIVAGGMLSLHLSQNAQAQDATTASPAALPPQVQMKQAMDAESECKDDYDLAKQACTNSQSTAGMSSGVQQQAAQLQAQVAAANGQSAATQQAMAEQCKLQADVNAALSALSSIKGNACSSTISDCTDACSDAIKKMEALNTNGAYSSMISKSKKYSGQCSSLSSNSNAAMTAAAALLGGLLQNLACDELTMLATPTPVPTETCADPTYAATSTLCICQNDPKNAMCTAAAQFPAGVSTTDAPEVSSPTVATDDTGTDGALVKDPNSKPNSASGSQTTEGGGGGGGVGGNNASGRGNTGADDGGGAQRSNVDKNVIVGQGSGSGGSGGSGGAPTAAAGGGAGARGGGGKGSGSFDLSKFLPKAGTRGIANMSISAKDGITGATGPSIWEKVSNQYQLQKPNLIQDK